MLTIKSVATVVSNYQDESLEDAEAANAGGCGRNCLGKCCLPFSKLSLYAFKEEGDKQIKDGVLNAHEELPPISFLQNLLFGLWEDRMNKGLFRYDVTTCETKVIPGQYGFIVQLNEGRHLKKRLTEFWVDCVLQPFDESKFNFTKVGQEEVLFRFEQSKGDETHFFLSAPDTADSKSINIVAINVSPIEYGHILLIPRVLDCLPQRIDRDSFLLAIHLAEEAADPFFRLAYNSLGAFATINHLHFQGYYLSMPFPVERAPRRRVQMKNEHNIGGVVLSEIYNYPVRSLVFEGGNTKLDLSDAVASSCIFLQNENIPFNILISHCGREIFLFPQCFAEKQARGLVSQEILETRVNPAGWEISGHIVLKRKKDFEDASEDSAWRLLAEVSLSEEKFEEVKGYVVEACCLQKEEEEEEEEAPLAPSASQVCVCPNRSQYCLVT